MERSHHEVEERKNKKKQPNTISLNSFHIGAPIQQHNTLTTQ
jgi:hypothetical protein